MAKIIVKNLSKAFKERTIFQNVSFEISDNNKIGLIGDNGIGKSTLKNILIKEQPYDEGSINYFPDNLLIGVIDENLYKSDEVLSGGEATKKAILKILHGNYDIFILDEPTNHLDLSGVQWLEKLINSINRPMIIISHDRFFLDQVTNKTYVLTENNLKQYNGNYSAYRDQVELEITTTDNLYNKQQREIKELEQNIRQRKEWFNKAHKAAGQNDHLRALSKKHVSIMRSKEKKLEKIKENQVKRIEESQSINLKLKESSSFKTAVRVTNLSKAFDNKVLFTHGNFTISGGERVGIIGNNGTGKTTLINMILGKDEDYEGDIYINPNMKISNFSQCLEALPKDISIIEYLLETKAPEYTIRLYLGSVFIKGDRVYSKIGNLSMGEKCRVVFTRIILDNPDLIILDEPTNYMDIKSRERVEDLLQGFNGTVLVVSHDRKLITKVCRRVLKLDNKKIIDFSGDEEEITNFFNDNNKNLKSDKDLKAKKDELLLMQCRLSELSGILNTSLSEEDKTTYEKEFLLLSQEIRNLSRSIL